MVTFGLKVSEINQTVNALMSNLFLQFILRVFKQYFFIFKTRY